MLDFWALVTDGLADFLTILNVLIVINTSYRNSEGLLVTDKYKTFRQTLHTSKSVLVSKN